LGRRAWVNLVLAAGLVAAWMAVFYFRVNPERRNPYWLQGMVETAAFEPQSANPFFSDRRSMRLPPVGTVARHFPPEHLAGGEVLSSPFSRDDAEVLQRGQTVFSHTCQACHGAQGEGDGTVVLHGFPRPPSLLARHARGLTDGAIYRLVTLGDGIMPSYAAKLVREDRWKAVLYVRQLQATVAATPVADIQGR
jgi:mono/diheme cytochrome c family protein